MAGLQPEREKLTHMLFEELVANGVFLLDMPVLSLYCVGKMSGCVIDVGYGKIGTNPLLSEPVPRQPCF